MRGVLEREGIRFAGNRAMFARMEETEIVAGAGAEEIRCDLLLIAAGRNPTIGGLDLDKAGVAYSGRGITVDSQLRTNVKHIYAAGNVTGGYQFTHFARWQAFQAVRNALLPGSSLGRTDVVPWVTFTDPEVAHIGLTESEAREKYADAIDVRRWELARCDRAVCENDHDGFLKIVFKQDGTVLGATMVAARAGEAISELVLAIKHGLKASDLASTIHAYPTYSTAIQQLTAEKATDAGLSITTGKLALKLSKLLR